MKYITKQRQFCNESSSQYMEGPSASVRKGAWTEEEDILLKKCIEKYGEGKWHQVSSRAGLNRCRKSCRLRWLNYLKPDIKRGVFADDEVDLIVRLHNLLGNRWSLIAGRLPGRTANDVKNYWNTHLQKKKMDSSFHPNPKSKIKVIKPQPQILSKKSVPRCSDQNMIINTTTTTSSNDSVSTNISNNNSCCFPYEKDEIMWWENLMMDENEINFQQHQSSIDHIDLSVLEDQHVNKELELVETDKYGSLGELYLDDEIWNVFNP